MTNSDFRMRSAARDAARDTQRFGRACGVLRELLAEIRRESSGLERRYRDATDTAAFALQALENEASGTLSHTVDQMSETMARYRARQAGLRDQETLLADVLARLQPLAVAGDDAGPTLRTDRSNASPARGIVRMMKFMQRG